MSLMDFWRKLKKAYKDSQIWNKIESSEDLKKAYQDSYEIPVAIMTCATMHFRSDYMIEDFERQARRMDVSRIKFYKLNYTGNSNLKEELSRDLGLGTTVEAGTFILYRNGEAIFKRHEELVDIKRLMDKLFEEEK